MAALRIGCRRTAGDTVEIGMVLLPDGEQVAVIGRALPLVAM